ncbi:MAG TPA: hypothetical protein DDW50_07555 [Firmicutes bacterium]|nr:hypothetical protein [Bacillota bacterium]
MWGFFIKGIVISFLYLRRSFFYLEDSFLYLGGTFFYFKDTFLYSGRSLTIINTHILTCKAGPGMKESIEYP